jgi:hypothetical protein
MTQQPSPPAPQSPAARYVKRLVWRLAMLALAIAAGYIVLILAWIVLNPRW